MFVYVGAATQESRDTGISVYRLNAVSGALSPVQTVAGLLSPTFLALHPHYPQRPFLYAVERQWTPEQREVGAVAALVIDPQTGALTLLNRVRSQGTSPCYVSVHPSGRYVFAAHFISGQVAAFPVGQDGSVGDATDVVQHQGCGPQPQRQQGPHAHFIAPDPSGTYVLACDLGIDKVLIYRLEPDSGRLRPNEVPYGQVASGEGPRHLAFHPHGRTVYVINEIGSSLSAFAYDGARGTLTHLQTLSTLPEGFTERNSCAQIAIHPSGRFVYGSNRGHDSVAVFAIDEETGRVRPIGHEPTRGKTPRNFNVDPTGTFLLAANQDSGTIVGFRLDGQAGTLSATGHVVETPRPVCIVFTPT